MNAHAVKRTGLSRGEWKRAGLACVLVAMLAGCDALIGVLWLPITTVRLVNDADFGVRVTVVYADEQNLPREVLEEVGTHVEFTLSPGETTSFSRNCNELQIVAVERAELMVFGEAGPNAESDTLRDGSDFGCRDIVTFTFDHSGAVTDFAVSTSVQKR